jgi:hypothetical protein
MFIQRVQVNIIKVADASPEGDGTVRIVARHISGFRDCNGDMCCVMTINGSYLIQMSAAKFELLYLNAIGEETK